MALVKIDPLSVVKDISPHDVGEEWTDVQNIRFNHKAAETMNGESLGATTPADPTHLMFSGQHNDAFWVYMGDGIIHATDFLTDVDIDTADNVSSGTDWDSCLFNLLPVMNNTVDAPWTAGTSGAVQYASLGQVSTLPAFPANTTCKVIRPYRDFLIAMNILETGNEQPNRLIWSDASDAGALPASWDIADPTTLAGDAYLTQTRGEIIDGMQLRDFFVIYKTHSIMLLRYTGGAFVMSVGVSQVNSGILTKNCVCEFNGRHFILADGDIHIYDGQSLQSVAEDKVRAHIFNNMDKTSYDTSYVTHFDRRDEIWVCYPETGQSWPNKAAIWNYTDDTWTFKDIGVARHISNGLTNFSPSPNYDISTGTYDSYGNVLYDENSENPTNDALAKATSFAIHKMDETYDNLGAAIPVKLEKTTMDLGTPSEVKIVSKVIPRINAISGTKLYVRIGTQMDPDDQITWGTEKEFIVGTDREVSTIAKGRFISVRFRTQDINTPFRFHGFQIEAKPSGRF